MCLVVKPSLVKNFGPVNLLFPDKQAAHITYSTNSRVIFGTQSDLLKKAIAESGMAHNAIQRATGVERASIMRFLQGKQSLRLDMADRLATFFGIEVLYKRKGRG